MKKEEPRKMKPVCICFQEDEIPKLKESAHYNLMSVSEFVRFLFHEYSKKKQK